MTFADAVFWIFAAMAVLPAVGILVAKSVVRMAFLLLCSLAGFAGLYMHLGAAFVGFTQVLVYIGGILILFLFGVMLTVRSDYPVRRRRSVWLVLPEALAGLLVAGCLVALAIGGPWIAGGEGGGSSASAEQLGMELLSTYVLPFEVVTVLLLAAMVGATYIARGEGAELDAGRAGRAGGPGTPRAGDGGGAADGRGSFQQGDGAAESPGAPDDGGGAQTAEAIR